jgi:hypothetical protein
MAKQKKSKSKTKASVRKGAPLAPLEPDPQWQPVPLMKPPVPPPSLGACSACIKYDTGTSTCRANAPSLPTSPFAGATIPNMPVRWPVVMPNDWCFDWVTV